jgi:hypothetical protein
MLSTVGGKKGEYRLYWRLFYGAVSRWDDEEEGREAHRLLFGEDAGDTLPF